MSRLPSGNQALDKPRTDCSAWPTTVDDIPHASSPEASDEFPLKSGYVSARPCWRSIDPSDCRHLSAESQFEDPPLAAISRLLHEPAECQYEQQRCGEHSSTITLISPASKFNDQRFALSLHQPRKGHNYWHQFPLPDYQCRSSSH